MFQWLNIPGCKTYSQLVNVTYNRTPMIRDITKADQNKVKCAGTGTGSRKAG